MSMLTSVLAPLTLTISDTCKSPRNKIKKTDLLVPANLTKVATQEQTIERLSPWEPDTTSTIDRAFTVYKIRPELSSALAS
jgi:hypothetical protein